MTPQERLGALIGAIYDCALDPGRWGDALARICAHLDSAAGTLAMVDLQTGRETTLVSVGIAPEFDRLYRERYHCVDLFIHPLLAREVCEPAISSDLVGDAELLSSRIYREWAAPQGFRDTLMTMFTRHHARLSFMGLTRRIEQRRYDASDRKAMQIIAPHLQRAVTIAEFIEHQRVERSRFVELVDSIAIATLVIDARRRIVHANSVARRMLDEGAVLRAADGMLALPGVPLARVLDGHRAQAPQRRLPESFRVRPPGAAADAIVVLMPLVVDAAAAAPRGPQYAVFVQDSAALSPMASDVWARLFGLTGSELRVLQGLIEGLTAAEIADRYGIARSTVKTHLMNLFRKTGTRRQPELVKVALGAIPPVQWTRHADGPAPRPGAADRLRA